MSEHLDRVRGRWQPSARPRSGTRLVRFVVALLAVSLASLSLLAFSSPDSARPASPAPTAPVVPAASQVQTVPDVADPLQLPAFPGASIVGHDERVVDSVSWLRVEYVVPDALQDEVRQHYRSVLRDSPWRVQSVDFDDGVWTLVAVDDRREARLDISVEEQSVRIVALVSDEVPSATPAAVKAALER